MANEQKESTPVRIVHLNGPAGFTGAVVLGTGPTHTLRPSQVHQIELAVANNLLAVHVAFLDHDLHRKNAVRPRRVLVAQGLGSLALQDAALQDLEDVTNVEDRDLLEVLAHHALVHVLAKLELLVAARVEQVLKLLIVKLQERHADGELLSAALELLQDGLDGAWHNARMLFGVNVPFHRVRFARPCAVGGE